MREQDKESLYQAIDELEIEESKDRDRVTLIIAISILIFIMLLTFPKIYIKSNIYYKSRNISQLRYKYDELKEERVALEQKLQKLKFKNQTIDLLY